MTSVTEPTRQLTEEERERCYAMAMEGASLREIRTAIAIGPAMWGRIVAHDKSFADAFSRAREAGWHEIADRLPTIARGVETMVELGAVKLESDNWWRLLSKRMPRAYGDEVSNDEAGAPNLAAIIDKREARQVTQASPSKAALPEKPLLKMLSASEPPDKVSVPSRPDDDDDLIG